MNHLKTFTIALLCLASTEAMATSCDQVIGTIDAKIKANGVKAYALEAIPVSEVKDQKIVGTCEMSTKKIVYRRTMTTIAATTPAADHTGTVSEIVKK